MSYLDKKFSIPEFIKEKNLVERALNMRYEELVDYIVKEISIEAKEYVIGGINQAVINRKVSAIIRALELDLSLITAQIIEKSFEEGQTHYIATTFLMTTAQAVRGLKGSEEKGLPAGVGSVGKGEDTLAKVAELTLRKNGMSKKDARELTSKGVQQRAHVERLFNDTFGDILLATQNTEESIKKVVREAVADVTQYHNLMARGYADQAEDLLERLSKQGLSKRIVEDGFVGIIDKAGRRWDLETYSKMVVQTKTNQAFRRGLEYEAEEQGFDLAVISSHGAKDACRNWEGVVVSLSGNTKGYPALSDVEATNEIFHPNCRHSIHGIREVDQLHTDDIAKHRSNMQKVAGYQDRVYRRVK